MVTKLATYSAPCVILGKDRLWWVFLLSSLATPFIIAALALIIRLIIRIHHNRKLFKNVKLDRATTLRYFYEEFEVEWITAVRDAADILVSTRFMAGQVMALLAFILSMCSLFIYYNTVSFFIRDVEQCQPWVNNPAQQVDFAFNCFFLLYFILRFAAAEDKVKVLFNIWSIIDYFTVPPAFVGLALDRDWIGLKFLRVLYLRRIPNLLAAVGLMTKPAKIKLTQLGFTWIGILLAAGGLFHLVENAGDPFYDDYDGQRITYWDFCYFAFGTMATLGTADVNLKTVIGKLANVFLVGIVLVVIAFAVPDVANLIGEREHFKGIHRKVHNEKHVVICGYITYESVMEVFAEFFHPDRDIQNIKLICLDMGKPNMDFEVFLKKFKFQIGYLRGSIMNIGDLHRAKVHEADACLILTNKAAQNAEAEDSNNIMRVVALKNYHPKLRVIVQLLQYRSKAYLTSIPNWNTAVGDDVICLPEVKLGLLAQNCIAPGFATMMANMFAARSVDETGDDHPEWMGPYLGGAGMEMYPVRLAQTFVGLSFPEAVEICYQKLNVLMLAISNVIDDNTSFFSLQFILNPPASFIVTSGMSACFLADSAKDAQRVEYYCRLCHDDVLDPDLIKPCACAENKEEEIYDDKTGQMKKGIKPSKSFKKTSKGKEAFAAVANILTGSSSPALVANEEQNDFDLQEIESQTVSEREEEAQAELERKYFSSFEKKIVYFMRNFGSLANWQRRTTDDPVYDEDGRLLYLTFEPRFDSTGMFWWCPPVALDEVLMDRFQASKRNFRDHIVLVIFAGSDSSVIGLNNFVMPLRSSSTHYEDLRDIVILSDPRFISQEWSCLMNFPKIHLVKVFGLSRADLRAVNIHVSAMCLLLTASSGADGVSTLLSDKDPILTSLTIKAMNFGLSEDAFSDTPIAPSDLEKRPTTLVSNGRAPMMLNHAARRITSMIEKGNKLVIPGTTVPLLTELINDSNVKFVEQDDVDQREFFMAEPFACGNAFATSVLQSLLVTTYFNPFILAILRAMIFGGITPEFEQILAEGAGLIGGPYLSEKSPLPDRCLVQQISIQDPRFARHSNGKYGALFLDALRHYGILCLGLSRKIAPNDVGPRSARRYAITHPPKDLTLLPHDKIFLFERAAGRHSH